MTREANLSHGCWRACHHAWNAMDSVSSLNDVISLCQSRPGIPDGVEDHRVTRVLKIVVNRLIAESSGGFLITAPETSRMHVLLGSCCV